ncbi:MAG: hypothetical protein ACLP6E_06110 [Acidimicrobiales bacterium]
MAGEVFVVNCVSSPIRRLPRSRPSVAQGAAFPVMAPLVFASSAFIPVGTMPGWLHCFAG